MTLNRLTGLAIFKEKSFSEISRIDSRVCVRVFYTFYSGKKLYFNSILGIETDDRDLLISNVCEERAFSALRNR